MREWPKLEPLHILCAAEMAGDHSDVPVKVVVHRAPQRKDATSRLGLVQFSAVMSDPYGNKYFRTLDGKELNRAKEAILRVLLERQFEVVMGREATALAKLKEQTS